MENKTDYYFAGRDVSEILTVMSKNPEADQIQKEGQKILEEINDKLRKVFNNK